MPVPEGVYSTQALVWLGFTEFCGQATDDTFVEKLHAHHENKSEKYRRPRMVKTDADVAVHFSVLHYAGEVRVSLWSSGRVRHELIWGPRSSTTPRTGW